MKSGLHARNPILLLALSFAAFLTVDTLFFRSDLYLHISAPWRSSSILYREVYFDRQRPTAPGQIKVLFVGNSRLGDSFSVADFEERHPHSPIQLVRGEVPASGIRSWYYAIRAFDPDKNRFAAVVVPAYSRYQATPIGVPSDATVNLVPFIHFWEWPVFLSEITDPSEYRSTINLILFPSHAFAADIQDLLLHPVQRMDGLRELRKQGAKMDDSRHRVRLKSDGSFECNAPHCNMEGIVYDSAAGRFTNWPANMSQRSQEDFAKNFEPMTLEQMKQRTDDLAAYSALWYKKIADYYKDTPTKLIFLELPPSPIPIPRRQPLPGAPDIRDVIPPRSNITFLDENEFQALAAPKYFADSDHFSSWGHDKFLDLFAKAIYRELHVSDP